MDKFRNSINGYNKKDVNKFVEDTTREFSNMLNKLKSKDQEIILLKEMLNNKQNLSKLEINKEASLAAKEEAKLIIDDAKRTASRIVNEALLEAEKTEVKAEQLRRNIIVFKRRMKASLHAQLATLDDIDEIKLDD